ncbi:uncharacterized protein LOC141657602 [Silene latifolia]|uniref:uncharacterized protein LOC141657602 n=1 Tax=Silene latifolia TaxID=37657 RepID=UPI003D770494
MPLTNLFVDVLGVVTISLVVLLVLIGLLCIIYTLYFSARIRSSAYAQLGYFNGPWVVRIIFILFGIFWGAGEVFRLKFFRQDGKVFRSLGQGWQDDICKIYILTNLGFTEPCLFLIMAFLLRASLKWRESGLLNPKWNFRTISYVLLYCFPIFVLNLIVVMVAPKLIGKGKLLKVTVLFAQTYMSTTLSGRRVITCTYPLLSTILHGLFAAVLTTYLLLLMRRMAKSVINKGLQKRVYILMSLVSSFLPLRVLLLGLSVLTRPQHFLFEVLVFCGFLVLLSCIVVGILILVYLPVANSLALNLDRGLRDLEAGGRGSLYASGEDITDSSSLIADNQSHLGRDSDASTKGGSISFRTIIKDEGTSTSVNEEEKSSFPQGFRRLSASSQLPS